jgi:phenylalanyl-tRNA synthetase beta chain
MHSCLKIVAHNIAFRSLDLRLFELGKAYFQPDAEDNWVEEERLMVAITGSSRKSWRENPRPYDFYDLLGGLEQLRGHLKWRDLRFQPAKKHFFDSEIAFDLLIDGEPVGWAGQMDRKILAKFEIKQPLYIAELSLNPLIKASNRIVAFEELPIYPSAPRDLAMIVDQTIKAGDIVTKVKKTAGKLAESVEIFDLYTGKQIEEGKKSIAISINYRSRERNLASEEVDAMQAEVIAALAKGFNAVIRDK